MVCKSATMEFADLMADFNEFRDRMIGVLAASRVFDAHESKEIVNQHTNFARKIRSQPDVATFKAYIKYNTDLMQTARTKWAAGAGNQKQKNVLDDWIKANTCSISNLAIKKYPSDIELWQDHLNFCFQEKLPKRAEIVVNEMLKFHKNNAELWIYAANWKRKLNKIDDAVQCLLLGIYHHPASRELNLVALRYAIVSGDPRKKGKDYVPASVLNSARLVFSKAMKNIPDIDHLLCHLKIAEEYDYTEDLQNEMVEMLKESFSNSEIMWEAMARREFRRKIYSPGNEVVDLTVAAPPSKRSIKKCLDVYKTAIKHINKVSMWSLYIGFLVEISADKRICPKYKKDALDNALEDACRAGCLSEEFYLIWTESLIADMQREKLSEVFSKALTTFPASVDLWLAQMRYCIKHKEGKDVEAVMQQAIQRLQERSLVIWRTGLLYYQVLGDFDKVRSVYEDGVCQPHRDISSALKTQYLEWVVLMDSVDAARELYRRLSTLEPYSLELHRKMMALEQYTVEINLDTWRGVYKLTCEQFSTSLEVWMEYAKWEKRYGDAEAVGKIREEAALKLTEAEIALIDQSLEELGRKVAAEGLPISLNGAIQ